MSDPESRADRERRVGLIVNPVAGLGGRVGLKGSDGAAIQQRALELGAVPRALDRTTEALVRLQPIADGSSSSRIPGKWGRRLRGDPISILR